MVTSLDTLNTGLRIGSHPYRRAGATISVIDAATKGPIATVADATVDDANCAV